MQINVIIIRLTGEKINNDYSARKKETFHPFRVTQARFPGILQLHSRGIARGKLKETGIIIRAAAKGRD